MEVSSNNTYSSQRWGLNFFLDVIGSTQTWMRVFTRKVSWGSESASYIRDQNIPREMMSLGIFMILTHNPQLLLEGLPKPYRKVQLQKQLINWSLQFNSQLAAHSQQICGLPWVRLPCWPLISNVISGTSYAMALGVVSLHLPLSFLVPSDPFFLAFSGLQAHNLYAPLMPMPETNCLRWD